MSVLWALYIVGALVAFILALPRGDEPPVKWWRLLLATTLWPARLLMEYVKAFVHLVTKEVDWRL